MRVRHLRNKAGGNPEYVCNVGFFSGRKKESIFSGKVGVTRSGKEYGSADDYVPQVMDMKISS
ncbi:hypothetical protein LguiA_008422 [Lonicera macranthoides]